MAESSDLNERDEKLVQWLAEAHAKEAELEADLTAHIALTEKQSYKRHLQAHLEETREHKSKVASRIEQLGRSPAAYSVHGIPLAAGEAVGKAIAAVKGQVGAARALLTEQAETHLRNAQDELREEHVEIALYTRLEVLATEVGDRETVRLATSIRRDEERMAKFLDGELRRLVKDVVRAEIPRAQRLGPRPVQRSRAEPSRKPRQARSSRFGTARAARS